ncbi:P-loop containing nucleoside triphosphate hydrolase protein [Hesseltinella vesiculosa]|uniref:Cell division control protein n=1 Tax=Hesseltinella vesiculosa TaxID=101127 RepID=A0A1X2G4Y6_9FUNG|nr:P-loop containing nucleoside triphosphate hydrolase protein [Hesseltinella vesiculosa]
MKRVRSENDSKPTIKKQSDIFQLGKALFRRTAIPNRLIGREREVQTLTKFWNEFVIGNQPGCLYISGSPGTGKTALLAHVKRNMATKPQPKNHQIKTVMINCMAIDDPKWIYVKLVSEFGSSQMSDNCSEAIVQAKKLLVNAKKKAINVVILDEIDHLVTKDQDVLYTLFEWASLPSSRLVLIGIANALDLTNRVLPRLRAKNCEPQLLNFNPYQPSDISNIIKDRLYSLQNSNSDDAKKAKAETNDKPSLPLMQPAAVELCAKKVAARKGDLRSAFDICQQAIELAQKEHRKNQGPAKNVLGDIKNNTKQQPAPEITTDQPLVTIRHVIAASNPITAATGVNKLKSLTSQQQIVLATFLNVKQKNPRILFMDARNEYMNLIKANGTVPELSNTEFHTVVSNIQDAGMVTMKMAKEHAKRQILLNIDDTDIQTLIEHTPLLKTLFQ